MSIARVTMLNEGDDSVEPFGYAPNPLDFQSSASTKLA